MAPSRKAKALTRTALCDELINLHNKNRSVFERIDAIKTQLKAIALEDGSFRETFVGLGYVSVSPAKPERIEGEAPELEVAAFQDLPDARREKLITQGLVRIVPIVKSAYHGRVDVKLHPSPTT